MSQNRLAQGMRVIIKEEFLRHEPLLLSFHRKYSNLDRETLTQKVKGLVLEISKHQLLNDEYKLCVIKPSDEIILLKSEWIEKSNRFKKVEAGKSGRGLNKYGKEVILNKDNNTQILSLPKGLEESYG